MELLCAGKGGKRKNGQGLAPASTRTAQLLYIS